MYWRDTYVRARCISFPNKRTLQLEATIDFFSTFHRLFTNCYSGAAISSGVRDWEMNLQRRREMSSNESISRYSCRKLAVLLFTLPTATLVTATLLTAALLTATLVTAALVPALLALSTAAFF